MQNVVVTGASTGIGWGCVKVLIARGFHVFGSVRKQADADRLETEFGARFTALVFDVTDDAAVKAGAATVAATLGGQTLSGLVNNAGIAIPGPLLYLGIDEFRRQLEVNVTGQLLVTQAFAPLLGADRNRGGKPGRIVMMSSIGGKNASPFVGAYNTSKFALEGFSESLRRELMIVGIDVVIVAPGAVATPIWDMADAMDVSRYAETVYAPALDLVKNYMISSGHGGLPPERIGETVWKALTLPHPKTRYVVTADPLQNFLAITLPKRWVDRIIAGRTGLKPGGGEQK